MKNFFKKSEIYKKFDSKKIKDAIEDAKAGETTGKLQAMKSKYTDLMKKYGFVMAQVNKQNEIATNLLEMSQQMPEDHHAQVNATVSAN
jgi:hypothetical protein